MRDLGPGSLIPFGAIAIFIAIDQYTKRLIESSLRLGESVNIIPGFFDITFIRNSGAAFGILSQHDSVWVQRGFTLFTLVALVIMYMLYKSTPSHDRVGRVALLFIAAGAIGNLIGRVQHGAVTDFLLFYIGEYRWPAFNVADSLITVGVFLLVYSMIFVQGKPDTGQ